MTQQLEAALATVMVEEVGVEETLRILHETELRYMSRNPNVHMPVDLIGMAGYAKMYAEQLKHEGRLADANSL
jgi:hypothetical protein